MGVGMCFWRRYWRDIGGRGCIGGSIAGRERGGALDGLLVGRGTGYWRGYWSDGEGALEGVVEGGGVVENNVKRQCTWRVAGTGEEVMHVHPVRHLLCCAWRIPCAICAPFAAVPLVLHTHFPCAIRRFPVRRTPISRAPFVDFPCAIAWSPLPCAIWATSRAPSVRCLCFPCAIRATQLIGCVCFIVLCKLFGVPR